MWKEATVFCLIIQPQHIHGGTEQNHETPQWDDLCRTENRTQDFGTRSRCSNCSIVYLITCIREVPGSNFGCCTGCFDEQFVNLIPIEKVPARENTIYIHVYPVSRLTMSEWVELYLHSTSMPSRKLHWYWGVTSCLLPSSCSLAHVVESELKLKLAYTFQRGL